MRVKGTLAVKASVKLGNLHTQAKAHMSAVCPSPQCPFPWALILAQAKGKLGQPISFSSSMRNSIVFLVSECSQLGCATILLNRQHLARLQWCKKKPEKLECVAGPAVSVKLRVVHSKVF